MRDPLRLKWYLISANKYKQSIRTRWDCGTITPGIEKSYYEQFVREQNVFYLFNQTYDILQNSEAAIVTSGTATLETALFNVPQIVCYKGSLISYLIARQLIKVKYISLVNLIANKEVVPELIQLKFNEKNLKAHFERLVLIVLIQEPLLYKNSKPSVVVLWMQLLILKRLHRLINRGVADNYRAWWFGIRHCKLNVQNVLSDFFR